MKGVFRTCCFCEASYGFVSPPTKQLVVGLGSVSQEEELVQSGGGQKLLETSLSMSLYLIVRR